MKEIKEKKAVRNKKMKPTKLIHIIIRETREINTQNEYKKQQLQFTTVPLKTLT
jgi:hypothetical protein